jgi:hypothetical protein
VVWSKSNHHSFIQIHQSSLHPPGHPSSVSGVSSSASGFLSTANGFSSTANGFLSSAFGVASSASGFLSSAYGFLSSACGGPSSARGFHDLHLQCKHLTTHTTECLGILLKKTVKKSNPRKLPIVYSIKTYQ